MLLLDNKVYYLLGNLSKVKQTGEYYSHSALSNKNIYISNNILVYSFKIPANTELANKVALLTFTNKIKVLANIVGVVDTAEITVISDINKNAIVYGSSMAKTLTKDSHCFGIVFIEQ